MMRSILSKVMWVGRATVVTTGLAVTLALMLGVGTVALAAVPGDPSMLRIDNNGSGAALDLQVEPGKAPMKVNSGTKVANLNSDTVDGYDSFDFYQFGEKVQDSEQLDGIDSSEFFTQRTSTYYARGTYVGPGGGQVRGFKIACDPGDRASGGGGDIIGTGDFLQGTAPLRDAVPDTEGWSAIVQDNGSASEVDVYAVCIDFAPFRP